jgi:hypothetical protein
VTVEVQFTESFEASVVGFRTPLTLYEKLGYFRKVCHYDGIGTGIYIRPSAMPIDLSINYKASKNDRNPHKCEQLRNDNLNSINAFLFPLIFQGGCFRNAEEKN